MVRKWARKLYKTAGVESVIIFDDQGLLLHSIGHEYVVLPVTICNIVKCWVKERKCSGVSWLEMQQEESLFLVLVKVPVFILIVVEDRSRVAQIKFVAQSLFEKWTPGLGELSLMEGE